jgi:hypothetical protein
MISSGAGPQAHLASDGAIRVPVSPPRAAASRRRFSRPVRCGWKRGASTIAPTPARALSRLAGTGRRDAAIGPGQAEQDTHERGLARAVRPRRKASSWPAPEGLAPEVSSLRNDGNQRIRPTHRSVG